MYIAKEIENIDRGPECWNGVRIGIYEVQEGVEDGEVHEEKKVGEYERNYHTLYNTFFAFKQREQWYALYSPDYTCTRIMTLPDCKDIGGEEPHAHGFCPVEFYVPWNDGNLLCIDREAAGTFGFISGCHWGDDSSWKIQYLDLSRASEGIIVRDDRFGYIEQMANLSLKQSVDLSEYFYDPKEDEPEEADKQVTIACMTRFPLVKKSSQESPSS